MRDWAAFTEDFVGGSLAADQSACYGENEPCFHDEVLESKDGEVFRLAGDHNTIGAGEFDLLPVGDIVATIGRRLAN